MDDAMQQSSPQHQADPRNTKSFVSTGRRSFF